MIWPTRISPGEERDWSPKLTAHDRKLVERTEEFVDDYAQLRRMLREIGASIDGSDNERSLFCADGCCELCEDTRKRRNYCFPLVAHSMSPMPVTTMFSRMI